MLRLVPSPVGSTFSLITNNNTVQNSRPDKLFLLICATHTATYKTSPNQLSSLVHRTTNLIHKTNNGLQQETQLDKKFKFITEFNDLLMAFVDSNELQLAFKLFSTLSSCNFKPNYRTYSIMIRYYCKNKEPEEAKRLLHHMLDEGFRPNIATFTILVNEFCTGGRVRKALEIIKIMRLINCNPNIQTYNCLLKGLCYLGNVEEAYKFLITIKNKYSIEPDIYTYTITMDGFCKVGRSDEAFELLDRALELGLVPNVATYNTLFNGYFKEGKPLEGIKLLKLMRERDCTPDYTIYSTLLYGLLKWGEIREALGVYEEMVGIGFRVDERMTNTLLRGLCRRSRREKELLNAACKVFDEMNAWGSRVYDISFDLVIEAFCRGRKADEALECLESMVGFGYNPKETTFRNVIRLLCDEGRVEEGFKVLIIYQENGSLTSASLGIMIDKLYCHGRIVGASAAVYGFALKLGVNAKCNC